MNTKLYTLRCLLYNSSHLLKVGSVPFAVSHPNQIRSNHYHAKRHDVRAGHLDRGVRDCFLGQISLVRRIPGSRHALYH